DRNINADGGGKYALVNMRRFREIRAQSEMGNPHAQGSENVIGHALNTLQALGVLEDPDEGDVSEFFVLKLRDVYAEAALRGYADAVRAEQEPDLEYAEEIDALADRAGRHSPFAKHPD
ncbi:MAG: hypothetical protein AB1698_17615, partial [Pseudomonadota bacterium]